MRMILLGLLLAGSTVLSPLAAYAAASCPIASGTTANYHAVLIGLPSGVPSWVSSGIQGGMGQWNNCEVAPEQERNGWDFANFTTTGPAEATINVVFVPGVSDVEVCAEITHAVDGSSGTITLYERTGPSEEEAEDCNTSQETVSDLTAHELGHYLGLDHGCSDDITGPIPRGPGREILTADWGVSEAECNLVDTINTNPQEEFQEDCGGDQGCGNQTGGSPILLDLDRNGFRLSGLGTGVFFDVDADRELEFTSWIRTGSGDAFLCRDRNGNGLIDGGKELFGDATRSLFTNSFYAQGYDALGEYDLPLLGGNGDGAIDRLDAFYRQLCVWTDINRNGLSEAGELRSLSTAGIERISLDAHRTSSTDRYGNEFRFVSPAWAREGDRLLPVRTTDVFLLVGE